MLLPHQSRVVNERTDLDDKISRLTPFIASSTFAALDVAEQDRLQRQLEVMRAYSAILTERIDAFKSE